VRRWKIIFSKINLNLNIQSQQVCQCSDKCRKLLFTLKCIDSLWILRFILGNSICRRHFNLFTWGAEEKLWASNIKTKYRNYAENTILLLFYTQIDIRRAIKNTCSSTVWSEAWSETALKWPWTVLMCRVKWKFYKKESFSASFNLILGFPYHNEDHQCWIIPLVGKVPEINMLRWWNALLIIREQKNTRGMDSKFDR